MLDDLSGERHERVGSRPARYRAVLLGPLGQIVGLIALTARDDDVARQLAEALVDGRAVELWDGLRFIEHFAPAE